MDDVSYEKLYYDYTNNETIAVAEKVIGEEKFRKMLIQVGREWLVQMSTDELYKLVREVPEQPWGHPSLFLKCLKVLRRTSTSKVKQIMQILKLPTLTITNAKGAGHG